MVIAVEDRHFHVHHRIPGEDAAFEGLFHALLDGRNKLFRDGAAMDFILELETLGGIRLHSQLSARVLAAAAGLLLVRVVVLGRRSNGFAIGNLRLADVGAHLELALHAVHDDLEMQLAHAGDDGLAGVGIGGDAQGGIFLHQLLNRHPQLFLVGLGFRLDRKLDDRFGEIDRFEEDGMIVVANGVAGDDVLQPNGGANVAREDFLNVLALVGVHLD